jgi:hypothetical protein
MKSYKIAIIIFLAFNKLNAQSDAILNSSIKISPPQTVQASDGTFEKEVQISWQPLGKTYEYLVFRSESPVFPPKTGIVIGQGWQKDNHISDRHVDDGKFYYYFIKAKKGKEESSYSFSDRGHSVAFANENRNKSTSSMYDSLKADIRLSESVYPLSGTISLGYMIENAQKQAVENIQIRIYLSKDEILSENDVSLCAESVGRIEGQSTKRNALRCKIPPSVSAGNYWLLLVNESDKRLLVTRQIVLK